VSISAIGTLVVEALSMAAETALKGAVGELTKDSYRALKAKVVPWVGRDLEILEEIPDSQSLKLRIAEEPNRTRRTELRHPCEKARSKLR
jgi:hypothetical protein